MAKTTTTFGLVSKKRSKKCHTITLNDRIVEGGKVSWTLGGGGEWAKFCIF